VQTVPKRQAERKLSFLHEEKKFAGKSNARQMQAENLILVCSLLFSLFDD